MHIYLYLMTFQGLRFCETSPTSGTTKRFFGRVSGNVTIKAGPAIKFFPAKCAPIQDRIFGMFSFNMARNMVLVEISFLATGKYAREAGSFPRSVHGDHVPE